MKLHLKLSLAGLFLVVIFSGILTGCYPGGAEYIDELDLVGTQYDEEWFSSADGTNAKTYYIPDSMYRIRDSVNNGNNIDVPTSVDRLVVSATITNMNSIGWTRLDTIDAQHVPDVVLVSSVIATKTTVVTPGYPGYGWGWGWGGWGGYYPPYYPGYGPGYGWGYPPTVSSYSTGTIILTMTDPNAADDDKELIPIRWMGGLNGMISSSGSSNTTRISEGIDQLFIQSSYLQR